MTIVTPLSRALLLRLLPPLLLPLLSLLLQLVKKFAHFTETEV